VKQVAISEFKAKCLSLLEQVQRTREPLRITRHGKAVAEVVPTREEIGREAMFGSMKGSITILGDILSPADDADDWEVLRD
jgi:prevent-host-death family protein